jgi:LuxR family maltose regulon positive regulatory protein
VLGAREPPAAVVGEPAPSVVARRRLFATLGRAESGATLLSASAGSGKTVLLRSWIEDAGLQDRAAWVTVERDEQDVQRFWLSVVGELRRAGRETASFEKLAPTPQFDADADVARLLSQLRSLEEPVVLVVDDLHELHSPQALAQVERLLAQRPPLLRIVLSTRHDPRLGLHRLRVAGELTEIRAADLRFTVEETRELLASSGIVLSDDGLAVLHDRTEGWAAGLRLAVLSLAGHAEPDRFVRELRGSDRMIADYLLAEVLERRPEEVRRLLLRTSVLDRVNGALADFLTGGSGGERILLELEDANAFVASADAGRSWFRYHHLFADFLRLELRRTEPDRVGELHRAAAQWYAEHDEVVDAVRHAQAGADWAFAGRLLADHSLSLTLDGREATVAALLRGFPSGAVSADPELTVVLAAQQLSRGLLDDVATSLALAERHAAVVPGERRRLFETMLALDRASLARRRGDFGAVVDEVQRLLAPPDAEGAGEAGVGADVRAYALMILGIVELWALRLEEAERHLEQGLELARRAGRPYIEVSCLAHLGTLAAVSSFARTRKYCLEAIRIAEARGWGSDPVVAPALIMMAALDMWQARFEEAEQSLARARDPVSRGGDPPTRLLANLVRGMVEIARGRHERALASLRAADEVRALLVAPQMMTIPARATLVQQLVRVGETAAARTVLAGLPEDDREWAEVRAARAVIHLAEGNPRDALEVLAPIVGGAKPVLPPWLVQCLLLDAVARDRVGDEGGAEASVERALAHAEPESLIWPFITAPVQHLLERLARHRTAHGALLMQILDVLSGGRPADRPLELGEELTEGELRVLRYLPSNLSAADIGRELTLSVHTVNTHIRHIYAKLGTHKRSETVELARGLGLLGPPVSHR